MKRVKDGRRVCAGQVLTGTYNGSENRIQLWDGKFSTGYRIVEFTIAPETPTTSVEIMASLSTDPKANVNDWDFKDVQELAWAGWGFNSSTFTQPYLLIREGNMAIEDLWINSYTTGEEQKLNYYIVLEKYTFSDWDGAGILVENQSQAGPQ